MIRRTLLPLAVLLSTARGATAQDVPVLPATTSVISIRSGDMRPTQWTLDPAADPDVYEAALVEGAPQRVTFLTGIDSLSFLVEEGKQYDFVVVKDGRRHPTRIMGRRLVPAPGVVPGRVTVAANPERVCLDDRRPAYLNFDLVLRNGTARELQVREIRALVLDGRGEMIERRVVGQQSLGLLAPHRAVAPLGEAMMYNPLHFASLRAGARVRYEVDLAGHDGGPATLTLAPQPCATAARLILPLSGRVAVYDGHDHLSHHRRSGYLGAGFRSLGMNDNPWRFALDLMVVDEAGTAFRGDGTRNEDWLGWGRPVRAAGDGIVAAVHDGQPDNTIVGQENLWTQRSLAQDPMTPAGNYVLIDHGGGEFSLASHLRQGSVRVRQGDRVRAGDVVAAVGNSGSSLGPHLHYELRSGFGVRDVRGLPALFHDVTVVGTGEGADGRPVLANTGDVLLTR